LRRSGFCGDTLAARSSAGDSPTSIAFSIEQKLERISGGALTVAASRSSGRISASTETVEAAA
jgi:hypothetical protein